MVTLFGHEMGKLLVNRLPLMKIDFRDQVPFIPQRLCINLKDDALRRCTSLDITIIDRLCTLEIVSLPHSRVHQI